MLVKGVIGNRGWTPFSVGVDLSFLYCRTCIYLNYVTYISIEAGQFPRLKYFYISSDYKHSDHRGFLRKLENYYTEITLCIPWGFIPNLLQRFLVCIPNFSLVIIQMLYCLSIGDEEISELSPTNLLLIPILVRQNYPAGIFPGWSQAIMLVFQRYRRCLQVIKTTWPLMSLMESMESFIW